MKNLSLIGVKIWRWIGCILWVANFSMTSFLKFKRNRNVTWRKSWNVNKWCFQNIFFVVVLNHLFHKQKLKRLNHLFLQNTDLMVGPTTNKNFMPLQPVPLIHESLCMPDNMAYSLVTPDQLIALWMACKRQPLPRQSRPAESFWMIWTWQPLSYSSPLDRERICVTNLKDNGRD